MKRLFAALLFLMLSASQAFGGINVITPEKCKLFDALTFGQDRKSNAITLASFRQVSFHLIWGPLTGTVDGACKVQVSNDVALAESSWIDKTGAVSNLSGSTGVDMINVTSVPETYYRLNCAHGSTTGGPLTAYCSAKE
jgi:hypothetical protein